MIIPAILEKNFTEIKNKILLLDQFCPNFQIDIVDGHATDGESYLNAKMLDTIQTEATFELDLMVENPQDYVNERIVSVFKVCANINALKNIPEFIQKAKEQDYLVGVSINVDTPLDLIDSLVGDLDYIQFMGVVPGAQGRTFDKKVIAKIKDFKRINIFIYENFIDFSIFNFID